MNRRITCLLLASMAFTAIGIREIDAQTFAVDRPNGEYGANFRRVPVAPPDSPPLNSESYTRQTVASLPNESLFSVSNGKPPVGGENMPAELDGAIDIDFVDPASRSPAGELSAWSGDLAGSLKQQFANLNVQKMLTSLAMVVGGYLALLFLIRMINPRGSGRLPASVFEVVGSAQLNNRQSLQVVRLGSRLLMLLVSPEGAQPVGEISQPGEVQSMIAECERSGATRRSSRGSAGSQMETSAALEKLVQMLQKSSGHGSQSREFVA